MDGDSGAQSQGPALCLSGCGFFGCARGACARFKFPRQP
jgi:hypothetical protein